MKNIFEHFKKHWFLYSVLLLSGILIVVFVIAYIRKKQREAIFNSAVKPPVSNDPLSIIKADYICPGGKSFSHSVMNVTSILSSLIKNNEIYIPSKFNYMNELFGQSNPNWCGCPNECTHTRLDVRYQVGSTIYDVSFADDNSIIINRK